MIKILIIEDNKNKKEKIHKALVDELMLSKNNIIIAESIIEAKKQLSATSFDLVILDLFLPTRKGDNPQADNGLKLLKEIDLTETINVPLHIIGLTAEEIKPEYQKIFFDNCWHIIQYEINSVDWQDKIIRVANHLIKTRKSFLESQKIKFDVAIITALQSEFDEVLELCSEWSDFRLEDETITYKKTKLKKEGRELTMVIACLPQMGMTASANLCTKMLNSFSPRYVFMSGICAGIDNEKLNFGDIIIAEQSWDYGSGKLKEGDIGEIQFEQDPRPLQLCPELRDKVNIFNRKVEIFSKISRDCKYSKGDKILKPLLGPVASGSYVVASQAILNDIKQQQRKLLAVEMEGYGMYYAAEHTNNQKTKAMMVKSVSDFGDSSKNDSYQKYAAYTSARYIYHFILEELI